MTPKKHTGVSTENNIVKPLSIEKKAAHMHVLITHTLILMLMPTMLMPPLVLPQASTSRTLKLTLLRGLPKHSTCNKTLRSALDIDLFVRKLAHSILHTHHHRIN
jgi:hypothetical protein